MTSSYDNRNTPQPNVQQEAVYRRFSSETGALIRQLTPSDRIVEMNPVFGSQPKTAVETMLKANGGKFFELVFAIAATSSNPTQFQNAMGTLAALDICDNDVKLRPLINQSLNEFLNSRNPVQHHLTDGGQTAKSYIKQQWDDINRTESDPTKAGYRLTRLFGTFALFNDRPENYQHWTEACISTILDPDSPFGLRVSLLKEGWSLGFGTEYTDKRFAPDASFWGTFNLSWIYPDSSATNNDRVTADLRQEVEKLRQMVSQGAVGTPEVGTSVTQLMSENDQLRQQLEETRVSSIKIVQGALEKMEIYKKIGGHPLDMFKISYNDWKSASSTKREEMVKSYYRNHVRNFHPDLHHGDDAIMAEIRTNEFNRLTLAQTFLLDHLNDPEF